MKKLLITTIGLLLTNIITAQTDYSGRTLYRATREKKTALQHTHLKVNFNFSNQTLNGEEWLTAAPYFYPTDSLVLDAKAMLIHKVALEKNKTQTPLKFAYKNNLLKIKLDKTYQKDEKYTVYIQYTAQPEKVTDSNGEPAFSSKGLYFINPNNEPDKPMQQVWTQGETEASSCWFPTIDDNSQKTTQEIEITVPNNFVTLSNGVLKNSKTSGNNRTDHWVMDKPHAPYLFFMAAGEFAIVKDTPWKGKVPIEYYVEKEYESVAKQIFGNTAEMLTFFSERFGYEFPWQRYAQIVVRDFVSGAMENTTAVSHAETAYQTAEDLADQNHWERIIAHELAHHWFGDLVTAESWANLTVNESFANYSEYLWLEHKYNKDVAEEHLLNDTQQYKERPNDFAKNLVRFDYDSREDMFDLVSYNKGGAILHMLRRYLGDEAFFAGITHYLKNNQYSTGEAHQLRLSLEKVSGKDLNWFFNQWFFGNGNPQVEVSKEYDVATKKLTLKITQTQKEDLLFQFPLVIDIYIDGKVRHENVWVNAKKENTFTFSVEKTPQLVNINPDGLIIMEETFAKTDDEYRYQLQHAPQVKSRLQAVEMVNDKKILLLALQDPFFKVRIKALNKLEDLPLSTSEQLIVEKIATSDPENLAKSAAMWVLSKTKDKKYSNLFQKSLSAHSSAVKNAALNGLAHTQPALAKEFLEKANPKKLTADQLSGLAGVIVDNQMQQYLDTLLPYIVYYPFVKDPEMAANFQKAYRWAMHFDDTPMTEKLCKGLKEIVEDTENPFAQQVLKNVIDEGVNIKKSLSPTNSVEKQIILLQDLKKLFKQ